MKQERIPGGFYLKARKTQGSWIAHAPPHVREIWDWLLMNSSWKDSQDFERGQIMTSYKEIRDGLHWMVGWRKETYSKWDCEKAMKALVKATMIATKKTTRGLIITVLNFNKYQNPENYENHKEDHRRATRKPQSTDTISKEGEEVVRREEVYSASELDAAHSNGKFILTKRKRKLTGKRLESFLQFWDAFNYKKSKAEAADAWLDIPKLTNAMLQEIIAAAKREALGRASIISQGLTPKMPQGWITARRWEDEVSTEGAYSTYDTGRF